MNSDQIIEYFQRTMAGYKLTGDRTGLRDVQTAAKVLMNAANDGGDAALAKRFQIVASQAANIAEDLAR